jgi:hypothetical protein
MAVQTKGSQHQGFRARTTILSAHFFLGVHNDFMSVDF